VLEEGGNKRLKTYPYDHVVITMYVNTPA
jgi:hypothetical protein